MSEKTRTAFVIFKVEGEEEHWRRFVRDLLRQWESEHLTDLAPGSHIKRELLMDCSGEVSLESLETQFNAAKTQRSATLHQIVHQEKAIPYALKEGRE